MSISKTIYRYFDIAVTVVTPLLIDSKQCTKYVNTFKNNKYLSFGNFPEILQCFLTERFRKFPIILQLRDFEPYI